MSPRVFAVVVAWNDRDFLPELLTTLCPAPLPDVQVLVIDNGSDDGPGNFIRAQFPHVAVLRNARNLGHAQALNQAFRYAFSAWEGETLEDRAIFLASPDMLLLPGCLDRLRAELDARPEAGSACGTLLRAFRDPSSEHPFAEAVKSDVIENVGIAARKNRTFYARGAGEIDRGQHAGDPFGTPTSFGLFRAAALDAVRVGDRIMDADVSPVSVAADLAWRLRVAGWTARFVPAARAYRFCGVQTATDMRSRPSGAQLVPALDRWKMIAKNESVWTFLFASPRLFLSWLSEAWRPSRAWAPFAAFLDLPSLWPKRRAAQASRRVFGADARKMFG